MDSDIEITFCNSIAKSENLCGSVLTNILGLKNNYCVIILESSNQWCRENLFKNLFNFLTNHLHLDLDVDIYLPDRKTCHYGQHNTSLKSVELNINYFSFVSTKCQIDFSTVPNKSFCLTIFQLF